MMVFFDIALAVAFLLVVYMLYRMYEPTIRYTVTIGRYKYYVLLEELKKKKVSLEMLEKLDVAFFSIKKKRPVLDLVDEDVKGELTPANKKGKDK